MRKSLFFGALAISLMAAFAVAGFNMLQDRESGQVAAAVTQPLGADGESSIGSAVINESPSWGPKEYASFTSVSGPKYRGDVKGLKADHGGFCPFKGSELKASEF